MGLSALLLPLPLPLLLLLLAVASPALLADSDVSQDAVERCARQLQRCERSKTVGGGSVCGSDNTTYPTVCLLERAACMGANVTLLHRGRCQYSRLCWSDREFALGLSRAPQTPAPFVPRCELDGAYSQVQCHDATGFCWCVTPAGRLLRGTTRPKAQGSPRCDPAHGRRATRTPPPKKGKKGCGRYDRSTFNNNLVKIFRVEYNRTPQASATASQGAVLDWKFSSLDGDGDSVLSRKESASLRRLVRKSVRPRRCARQLARLCDMDRDGRISRHEWHACIGLDVSQLWGMPPPTDIVVESHKRTSQPDANDCLSDRQSVLEELKTGNNELYVPECMPDGRFQKIQCYNSTGYCWCVYEDSGKPIPGSSVKDQIPKCDVVPAPKRPIPGCSETRKVMFLKELMDVMSKKMRAAKNESSSYSPVDILQPSSVEEEVAKWNFNSLDKNRSKVLERKEWKHFRAMVTASKQLHRCGKKFPRYCDNNHDQKISLTEWLDCLNTEATHVANLPTPSYRKTKGNPLDSLLIRE